MDNGLDFSLLSLFYIDAREVGPLTIFILIEYSILLEDLEFREIKSSKNTGLDWIHLKIMSREWASGWGVTVARWS